MRDLTDSAAGRCSVGVVKREILQNRRRPEIPALVRHQSLFQSSAVDEVAIKCEGDVEKLGWCFYPLSHHNLMAGGWGSDGEPEAKTKADNSK